MFLLAVCPHSMIMPITTMLSMLFCCSWCCKAISKLKNIKDIAERWCAGLSKFQSLWQDKVRVLWNTFSSCGKILYFVSFKAFMTLESTERPQRQSDHFADMSMNRAWETCTTCSLILPMMNLTGPMVIPSYLVTNANRHPHLQTGV